MAQTECFKYQEKRLSRLPKYKYAIILVDTSSKSTLSSLRIGNSPRSTKARASGGTRSVNVGGMSGIRTGRLRQLSRPIGRWVELSCDKFLDGVGNQGSHFSIRPIENTRTGKLVGTLEHYNY